MQEDSNMNNEKSIITTTIMAYGEGCIKPNISEDEMKSIVVQCYGLKSSSFEQLQGYDDLNYHFKPKFSCNPFVQTLWSHGYVLKVMNSLDSEKPGLCVAQNNLMLFLREHNIPSPIPVQTMQGEYYVKKRFPTKFQEKEPKKEHIIRVLEFQPGTVLKNVPKTFSLLYKLGMFLGNLNEVLKEFHDPIYEVHSSIWHLYSAPGIHYILEVLGNTERKQLVREVIKKFLGEVIPKINDSEKGMIHGDFNEHNVLIEQRKSGEWEVSAILDFGDSHFSYYLFELAIALCYMMLECKTQNINPIAGAGHMIAGYLGSRPKFSIDFGLLKLCICARLCQSLVLGLRAFQLHPENSYVLDSQQMGWPLLEELWETSNDNLIKEWQEVILFYDVNK